MFDPVVKHCHSLAISRSPLENLVVHTRRLLPDRPASRLLRGACPRAGLGPDPWARNDSVSACHCGSTATKQSRSRYAPEGIICLVCTTPRHHPNALHLGLVVGVAHVGAGERVQSAPFELAHLRVVRQRRSGKSSSSPAREAAQTPRSVISPVTSRAGVTSKA
jgi:hypothetical protein